MENRTLSIPTIDYLEGQIAELRKVIRIVKKGVYKFSGKTVDKCNEMCELLDRHNISYLREDLPKVDLILVSVNKEIVKEI